MIKTFSITLSLHLMLLMAGAQSKSQQFPFDLRLDVMEIKGLPALQSYAYATGQGKWLLVGGRKDGLHRRQPWATFDEEGQNKYIYVVDPVKKQVWKRSLDKLPVSIQEQLQSTNMEFVQSGNRLILAGGYGYSKTADDHITYPYLAVLQVDELILSVINGKPLGKHIVQAKDERMAVTGGRLAKIADTFLLAGGQQFDGRYNPHGPDHGPGFTQQYTNEIRKFTIVIDKEIPLIKNYSALKDTVNLHRRDYNLVPQVFKNDEPGYTMFSGVFQYNEDIPFTNFVDIKGGSYTVNNSFDQRYSHYHNAVLPMFDRVTGTMYSIFFGGIARYFTDSAGKIFENKDVPFTKTISVIIRKDDQVQEIYLPIQMPGYLGAAAEFIFMPDVKLYSEGIIDAGLPENEDILIGYIVGGINSSAGNIFFENTGEESSANGSIIRVYLKRKKQG